MANLSSSLLLNFIFRYIEAMRRFILEGKRFKRTIHLLFVPGITVHQIMSDAAIKFYLCFSCFIHVCVS